MINVFYNCTIVTVNENFDIIKNGYMIVSDGRFTEIGEGLPENFHKSDKNVVDLKGKWVLPGLINTHCHTGMSLLRGYSDDLVLDEWLQEKMWPMEAKFKKETVLAGTNVAILEMLKTGTTTFLDMYHLYVHDIGEIVEKYGLRAVLTRGMIGLCSEEEQKEKLKDGIEIAQTWAQRGNGRITTMLSPHSPYTCPPSFLEKIIGAAKELTIPLHTHLVETKKEVKDHVNAYNKTPIVHLNELGFFDVPALIAHAVHASGEELEILAEKKVAVSHNPISNLKLGSGIAPIHAMKKKGITVAIGTDSVASNNNLDLLQEMRTALLVQKGFHQDPTVLTVEDGLRMVTNNGAKALGLNHIGQISSGYDADFITVEPNAAHLQPNTHITSHLVYAANGNDVSDVFVQGRQLMKNRVCLTLDEEKILFEANKEYAKLGSL